MTRLRAPAKAAEGTTRVKSYYYFLIGSAGIGYGLRLRPALPRLEGIQWVQCLSIMRNNGPPKQPLFIAMFERAYSGFTQLPDTH